LRQLITIRITARHYDAGASIAEADMGKYVPTTKAKIRLVRWEGYTHKQLPNRGIFIAWN